MSHSTKNNIDSDHKQCLIVSRLKEYWDLDSELIFVDGNIPDYNERDWLAKKLHRVIENDSCGLSHEIEAINFIEKRSNRYRRELAAKLNKLHSVQEDENYWGILLDSWLINFLSVVYDKTHKLKRAVKNFPNAFIYANEQLFEPPLDARSFLWGSRTEEFNQYIYSEISALMKVKIIRFNEFSTLQPIEIERKKIKSIVAKTIFLPVTMRWLTKLTQPTLVLDGYFSLKDALLITLCSKGKVLILPSLYFLPKLVNINQTNKEIRSQLIVKEYDFIDIVTNKIIVKCFPKSFLENYSANRKKIISLAKNISTIGTAICMSSNDVYKLLASEIRNLGGDLLGF